jgi:hypothetical protein
LQTPASPIHQASSGQVNRLAEAGRVRRPWGIPPGLGMPGEPFEAAAVLEEMYGDAAFLLWCVMRGVDLMVGADQADRGELFVAGAMSNLRRWIDDAGDVDETLREHMLMLANLLGDAAPEMVRVSEACAVIAEWASNAGFGRSAYIAALRGAAASPREPAYAYQAGIMARRIAEYVRAEAWLKRTIALSRHRGDARHHALALLGLANLHIFRYEFEAATTKLQQTLGIARRFALWDLHPRVYHDLFGIAITDGTPRQAAAYALAAARGYGRFHPRAGGLAHDVAHFLLCLNRAPVALRILRALPLTCVRSAEQLLVLGNLGWAAGAAGEMHLFSEVWDGFWTRLDRVVEYDRTSGALINLAWGAASLRDATRVEVAAREALRIAAPRGEMLEVLQAEQMLASLADGVFPEWKNRVTSSPEDHRDAVAAAELLVRHMLRWPQVWAPNSPSFSQPNDSEAQHQVQPAVTLRRLARRLPG